MNRNFIIAPLMFLLFVLFGNISGVKGQAGSFNFTVVGCISINISSSPQTYSNQTTTIEVRVTAEEDLRDVLVYIRAEGSRNEGYGLGWWEQVTILSNVDLSNGTVLNKNSSLTIPPNVSPGLAYGVLGVGYYYYDNGWHWRHHRSVFQLTYVKNRQFEELRQEYSSLNSTYNELKSKYNSLQAELVITRNTMYALMMTTIVSVGTALYLARRKPKAMGQ